MLPEVHLGRHCCAPSTNPDNYRPLVGDALIDEIQTLAQELAGIRVCQINATAAGGGVAELLGRQVPILRALGVDAEWRLIHGNPAFFALTKSLHNALQGADLELSAAVKQTYLARNRDCAARVVELLDDATAREAFGRAGHEDVRQTFLLPRLIRDKLRLITQRIAP